MPQPVPPLPPFPVASTVVHVSDERSRASEQLKAQWLGFLFWETLALLFFQLGAGYFASSLTLLADSGHSLADVVCYAINFLVERFKNSAGAAKTGEADAAVTAKIARMDLVGSGLSTLLLCIATWVAGEEAVGRLRESSNSSSNPDKSTYNGDDFGELGNALLAFAVVSTAANAGTLFLYYYWQVAAATTASHGEGKDSTIELEAGRSLVPPDALCAPCVPAFDVPRRSRKKGMPKLNLRNDFEGIPTPMKQSSSSSVPLKACASGCCPPVSNEQDGSGSSFISRCSSRLHFLVHPGCTGDHSVDARELRVSGSDSGPPHSVNLNLSSAMLHLIADVLRGITILVVAIVIELGYVSDPGRVDAICALFVALFVGLGSLTLFQRLMSAWRKMTLTQQQTSPSVAVFANTGYLAF